MSDGNFIEGPNINKAFDNGPIYDVDERIARERLQQEEEKARKQAADEADVQSLFDNQDPQNMGRVERGVNRQTEITDGYAADRQAEVTTRRHFQDSKVYSFVEDVAKAGFALATYVGAAELERRALGSGGSGKDLVHLAQDAPTYAKLLAEQLFAVGAGVANYASLGGKLTK